MKQPSLFDAPESLPYQPHSATSRAAAEQAEPSAETCRSLVLAYLRGHPATDEQIQFALRMPGNTERPRRKELVAAGLVRDSRRKRETKSGALATVWECVQ